MNKGQSLAVSTILAAAILLRPMNSSGPPPAESPRGDAGEAATTTQTAAGEGPWIASCNYWAPMRQPADPSETAPEVHGTLKQDQIQLHVHLDQAKTELGCRSDRFDRWGFPAPADPVDVTAIIATVPDPVHTHFALAFDRTVDAILQAAGDNHFVSSYYWLPWKNRIGELRMAGDQGTAEPGHDPQRERQPGLIILKYAPSDGASDGPSDVPLKVVYLFLVAETPTQGIDGFQFQRAFSYELELASVLANRGRFSTGGKNTVEVIGPSFSGSVASLSAAIKSARPQAGSTAFHVIGANSTNLQVSSRGPVVTYLSFGDDRVYSIQTLFASIQASGYDLNRVALLIEDNTAFGNTVRSAFLPSKGSQPLVMRFPREISLLRNAEVNQDQSGGVAPSSESIPSPYLRFSLKDRSAQDSVPQFSRENTPLSQESQLMTIARQLLHFRSRFIAIVATNGLDQIFLAQFLRRACPDARLVFFGSDLLMVREVDNLPFLGSVTITPYPLIGFRTAGRTYASAFNESMYNAASYAFWDTFSRPNGEPLLQGYRNLVTRDTGQQPSLWVTAIGSDGYYPLGILSPSPTRQPQILPKVQLSPVLSSGPPTVYPSRLWYICGVLVSLLCILHIGMLWLADYWSSLTRDLAVRDNDQPRRRSMLIHVATSVLFSMAFAVSYPVWGIHRSRIVQMNPLSKCGAFVTLLLGVLAFFAALAKTWGSSGWVKRGDAAAGRLQRVYQVARANTCLSVTIAAWAAASAMVIAWSRLCLAGSSLDSPGGHHLYLVGLSFCYRAINPGSGVSPLVPVLLLLFGWYLWAFFQTRRLRFSENGRPRIPGNLDGESGFRYFVSEESLCSCDNTRDSCLYKNITCLLITREWVRRVRKNCPADCMPGDVVLALVYAGLLVWFVFFTPVSSLDHFLWNTRQYGSNPYEMLIGALLFPLLLVCLSGCLRLILIWGSLKSGLLERLENQPLRFAFTRLKEMGWMTILRQAGLHEQYKDMARSIESIRQMLNQPGLQPGVRPGLHSASEELLKSIRQLQLRLQIGDPQDRVKPGEEDYRIMKDIEQQFAAFGRLLLSNLLIPYWKQERTGFVESAGNPPSGGIPPDPPPVLMAEEFLAIRYMSLIRAVLANMRYLMVFVTASFVLALLAWNSYPFQPRQQVDWLFTGLLAVLGAGMVWVFAQMHRNPILSRITDSEPNQLGWDFYFRVISFGALPVLAWVAYQFPDVGSVIYKFLQPGVPIVK